MNVSEERSYQKRLEVLEALGLTPGNSQLAEQYLEMSEPEKPELLAQAEHQDFSGLGRETIGKYMSYTGHLHKRGRKEECERLLKLVAAIGGSTAGFVLGNYSPVQASNTSVLRPEQVMAIRAETISRNIYFLRRYAILDSQKVMEKEPQLYLKAMDLCWGREENGKRLLAAAYLYTVKPAKKTMTGQTAEPAKKQGGLFKLLFSIGNKEDSKETDSGNRTDGDGGSLAGAVSWGDRSTEEVAAWLEQSLIYCIPRLFTSSLRPAELSELSRFVRESTPDCAFPESVSSILKGQQYSEYDLTLLSSLAFLAIDHSERFLVFLRLLMAVDLSMVLDACLGTASKYVQKGTWFYRHIAQLESALPGSFQSYIYWCVKARANDILRRMASAKPVECRQVLEQLPTEDYSFFLQQIRGGNPGLYRELGGSVSGTMRLKLAAELADFYDKGKEEARQYLSGEIGLSQIQSVVSTWTNANIGYHGVTARFETIRRMRAQGESCAQMYRRALVLEALGGRAGYFRDYYCWKDTNTTYAGNKELTRTEISEILESFTEEGLTASRQLEFLCEIYDCYWYERKKVFFMNESVQAVAGRRKKWEGELLQGAKNGLAVLRFLCIRVLDLSYEEYKEALLSCAADSAKQVRELLQAIYVSHPAWEPEIRQMLSSKKSQEREMAALVLKAWGVDSYREELAAALAKEKSKKLQELLQSILGIEGEKTQKPQAAAEPETAEQIAAALIKGGKKRKVAWAFPLCEVHKKDGQAVTEDYLAALFVAYADMGTPGIRKEARLLADELNPAELAACVTQLYDKWLENGAEAKKKWVLTAFSLHGGEGMVNVLYHQIQEWPKNARGAMACEAVKALALNGSSTALLLVDQISRKFKFRQVKAAAGEALAAAAGQLGISREELEDRIVPNLGFGEDLSQTFDYGPRQFKVVLTSALELSITDDAGKSLKNLPSPGKRDDEEKAKAASDAFKALKKQLKTVTANQKLRLEQALSGLRLWPVERWQELFVKNPVMHQFAIGLIWGRYEDNCLQETFRYMEDGSFNTVDEEEYLLPEGARIGLVHPIELSAEDLAAWKEQLADYEVTQPIPQLERPVYRIAQEEREETELTRFGGVLINGLSLSGKLLGQGWYRGSVQDGGCYFTFYREDGALGAELEFSGTYVGGENDEVTVYGVRFYRAGTVKRGSYVYEEIKKGNQYTLGEVSSRYFSEIVFQLTKATAASVEKVAYPECKK